jgi:hypothetical protein
MLGVWFLVTRMLPVTAAVTGELLVFKDTMELAENGTDTHEDTSKLSIVN